jgi:hypothetical protein
MKRTINVLLFIFICSVENYFYKKIAYGHLETNDCPARHVIAVTESFVLLHIARRIVQRRFSTEK